MRQERTDRQTAIRVEKGLLIQASSSTAEAATYMNARGVPMHVTMRVLLTHDRRDMTVPGALPE